MDDLYKKALKEAICTNTFNTVIHQTIQMHEINNSFNFFFVQGYQEIEVKLNENDEEKTKFLPYSFTVQLPNLNVNEDSRFSFMIQNVDNQIVKEVKKIAYDNKKVLIIYREYISTIEQLDVNPLFQMEFELLSIEVDNFFINAQCGVNFFINKRIPKRKYNLTEFPGLVKI